MPDMEPITYRTYTIVVNHDVEFGKPVYVAKTDIRGFIQYTQRYSHLGQALEHAVEGIDMLIDEIPKQPISKTHRL